MRGWNLRIHNWFFKLHKLLPWNLRLIFWSVGSVFVLQLLAWVLLYSARGDDLRKLHEWFDFAFRGHQLRVGPMLSGHLLVDGF